MLFVTLLQRFVCYNNLFADCRDERAAGAAGPTQQNNHFAASERAAAGKRKEGKT